MFPLTIIAAAVPGGSLELTAVINGRGVYTTHAVDPAYEAHVASAAPEAPVAPVE